MEADQTLDESIAKVVLGEFVVFLQADLAILGANPLRGLVGQDGSQTVAGHHLSFCFQAARQRVGSFQAVIEGGNPALQHQLALPFNCCFKHWDVDAVLHQRPPKILQERPETIWSPVERDPVGQYAV